MGCWDITCALTSLPIREKDPIRWFFLRGPLFTDSEWSHPWTRWIPISFPVQGVYNMYGGVEGWKENNVTRFQVECLRQYALRESADEEEEFLDRGDEDFPNTMESLVSACERGFLKLNLPYGEHDEEDKEDEFRKVNVSAFVVHEEVYQHMIARGDADPPGIGTAHRMLERGRDVNKTDGLKNAVEWEKNREERQELLDKHPDLKDVLLDRVWMMATGLTSHLDETPDVLVVGNKHWPDVTAWPVLQEFTDEDWTELQQRILEQDVFFWTMKELRREFFPARYTDQYWYKKNDLTAHRLLLHYTDQLTQRIQAEEKAEAETDE